MPKPKASSIPEYISNGPEKAQKLLQELYDLLKEVAPSAKEAIKWGSPVFEEKRIFFSFSAHKTHINFMPTRASLAPFEEDLKELNTGKDTIQLPYDKPLPKALIKKIAKHRLKDVRENDARWM